MINYKRYILKVLSKNNIFLSDLMAVPDYQSLMLPLLKYAGDGEEYKIRDAIEHLAEELRLSEEEKRELLPSAQQGVFNNRIGWACTYLKKAGLLDSGRKGYFSIT